MQMFITPALIDVPDLPLFLYICWSEKEQSGSWLFILMMKISLIKFLTT